MIQKILKGAGRGVSVQDTPRAELRGTHALRSLDGMDVHQSPSMMAKATDI